MAKRCPVCTEVNDDDADYCVECGIGFGLPSEHPPGGALPDDASQERLAAGAAPDVSTGRPPVGFVANLRALPASARWTGLVLVLVLVALVVANLLLGGGGSSSPATTSTSVDVGDTTASSTTPASSTIPVVTKEDLSREVEAEILRACAAAVVERRDPEVRWDPRWSAISTPEALLRATEDCVAARRSEQEDGTDRGDGAGADGSTTTTTEG